MWFCQFFGCGGKSFSKWDHVSTKKSYWVTLLWSACRCVYFIRPYTLLLCIFLYCIFLLYCTDPQVEVQIRILQKDKYRESNQNANTGNHTLISWTMLIGFLYFREHLASQDMFLVRSKLSITVYLFLVLYRSTSLQSLLFLKNIKTYLCKKKLVNNRSIPSTQQPYNHDSFSKISRPSTALQSRSFLKNIENFLCK